MYFINDEGIYKRDKGSFSSGTNNKFKLETTMNFFFKINHLKISNFKFIYLAIKRNAVRRI